MFDPALRRFATIVPQPTVPGKFSACLSGAKEKGIEEVVFDRGGYVYHGRVAALAEGAREGGLKF